MAGHKMKRLLSGLGGLMLALVAIAGIYLCALLLQTPGEEREGDWVVVEEAEPVTPLQPGTASDPAALARLFGAPLPYINGLSFVGEARNATHDGQTVRMATLRYDGVTISAVRPATAAPLLLRGNLSVDLRSSLTVLNQPAVLASRGSEYCLYFSDASAAYAIYAPAADEESFFALLERVAQAR